MQSTTLLPVTIGGAPDVTVCGTLKIREAGISTAHSDAFEQVHTLTPRSGAKPLTTTVDPPEYHTLYPDLQCLDPRSQDKPSVAEKPNYRKAPPQYPPREQGGFPPYVYSEQVSQNQYQLQAQAPLLEPYTPEAARYIVKRDGIEQLQTANESKDTIN